MIEFSVVDYNDVLEDIKEHIDETHREVGPFPEVEFDPNLDAYQILADKGSLAVFAAMDGDTLIGYSVFILAGHLLYRGFCVAHSDLLYVVPEHRGETSKAFIEFIDEHLYLDFGADGIIISMHTKRDFSPLLEHLGYQTTGIVCSKYVGDN